EHAEAFARELHRIHADDLVSVVLYGSAARGQYRAGRSDLNLLVVLRQVDPPALRRTTDAARAWVAAGNAPPLLLGEGDLRRSVDVFPIEYADIREAHRVLYGTDPFAGVEIDAEHLRLQCEHELKAKQIALREHYLLRADDPAQLGELLLGSISTFLVLFRTVLRLAGEPVPGEPKALVEAIARLAGFDAAPLHAVLDARSGAAEELRPDADAPAAVGYLAAVERVVAWVDRLSDRVA
ncbi:MAG TPA: nucleotidyltransferase domain-containing protein, partial [Lysobacter sp.]